MRSFWIRYKHLCLLVLVFLIAEILIDPLRDFPLNDDWSYAKSAMVLHNEGQINIGNWGAMSLVSHLLWGVLFTKTFGFSFVVLRISTMVSSFIGLFFFFKLLHKISASPTVAFLASLVLLFNPLYFNLSNTYMTDINFNTLLILFVYASFSFFERKNNSWLFLIFLLSFLLVFLRQFGIIAPVCFAVCCLFLDKYRIRYFLISILMTSLVYLSLKYYEHFLNNFLAVWSPYKYSTNISFTDPVFWTELFVRFLSRYKLVLIHFLVYAFPFLVFFLRKSVTANSIKMISIAALSSVLISVFLLWNVEFPCKNIFMNMTLGPETTYQSWMTGKVHNTSQTFGEIVNFLKYFFSAGSLFVILLASSSFSFRNARVPDPRSLLLWLLTCGYIGMLFVSESFFDRYHIPVIALGLILAAEPLRFWTPNLRFEFLPLLLLAYVSVAGTRDYLELNTKRWEAYNFLRSRNINTEKINGGFEINCWNEGKMNWAYNIVELNNFDYVIQFDPEPGFKLVEEFPFQRYFPYKKDKINIFVREVK